MKHRTLDQIRTNNFVIFPNFNGFRNQLVQNIFVSGFSWTERNNFRIVKQRKLWTNLSVSICNALITTISDLDETFSRCLLDISFAFTTQNMMHFKHNKYHAEKYNRRVLSFFCHDLSQREKNLRVFSIISHGVS